MERGLYIAASGMLAEQQRQDQIANDLSNATTSGYKADRSTQRAFGELLLQNTKSGQNVGSLGLGVEVDQKVTDWTAEPLRQTDEPLDFAIQGAGFFGVRTPDGVFYTRNGQFTANQQGQLITARGDVVLGPGGDPVQVGADGKVDARNVGVFRVDNPAKVGDNLVSGPASGAGEGAVVNGALEGSGADPARSMIDMIASFRAFEAGQKVIRTLDESLQLSAGRVGNLNG